MGDPREGEFGAAVLARMERDCMTLVKVAPTPIRVIFDWAEDCELACEPSALVDLAERLLAARLLFAERLEEELAGLALL